MFPKVSCRHSKVTHFKLAADKLNTLMHFAIRHTGAVLRSERGAAAAPARLARLPAPPLVLPLQLLRRCRAPPPRAQVKGASRGHGGGRGRAQQQPAPRPQPAPGLTAPLFLQTLPQIQGPFICWVSHTKCLFSNNSLQRLVACNKLVFFQSSTKQKRVT